MDNWAPKVRVKLEDGFDTGCLFGCGLILAIVLVLGILGPTVVKNLGRAWQEGINEANR
jgi:hypothetical protein